MKVVPITPETLREAVKILKNGGVIAHPADTCFGLAADLTNETAVRRVQAIKGRSGLKPMSVMISVMEQLKIEQYAKLNDFSDMIQDKLFPSPVTLLLPKGPAIPDFYFPETDLIGLRVPMHDLTQDLLRLFGGPLITTSANCSGDDICFKSEDVRRSFENQEAQPDLILEGELKEHRLASTVIAVKEDHACIVRKGPLTASQLEAILGVRVQESC